MELALRAEWSWVGKVKCPVVAFSLEAGSRARTLALEAHRDHVVQFTLLPVRKLRPTVLKSRGHQPRDTHSMPPFLSCPLSQSHKDIFLKCDAGAAMQINPALTRKCESCLPNVRTGLLPSHLACPVASFWGKG